MQPFQRTAARSVRQLRPYFQRQQRRFDSHGAHDAHHGPKNESFGASFYTVLAAIPVSYVLYKLSQHGSDSKPYFTRMITETYEGYASKWVRRNDLHTQLIEQAGADRLLFLNEGGQTPRHVELRFPENFNTGSPWNVPAGHGSGNIDSLIAKYEKRAYEENEKKVQQLRDNAVPAEQPLKAMAKKTPAAIDS